jgi:hypothetical protein
MTSDTPFIEYLIIGAHAACWLVLVVLFVFGISLSAVPIADAGVIIIALPFVYLLGMLVDSLAQVVISPLRRSISRRVFGGESGAYQDEFIARNSATLYNAYEARVQRVRIVGAAIFNWPALGAAVLVYLGFNLLSPVDWLDIRFIFVAGAALVLCAISIFATQQLYYRAFNFRKNACDVIRDNRGSGDPLDDTSNSLAAVAAGGDYEGHE